MEDSYLSILSTVNIELASTSAKILEESQIPFIAESVDLQMNGAWMQGFCVKVPSKRSVMAHQLLNKYQSPLTQKIEISIERSTEIIENKNNTLAKISTSDSAN